MLLAAVPGCWPLEGLAPCVTSHSPVLPAGPEKESPPRKKAGLASFRLSGLKSRDRGDCITQGTWL